MRRISSVLGLVGAAVLVLAGVLPAHADTVTFRDPRGDAPAR